MQQIPVQHYANIAIAARVFHPFTYAVPADLKLQPGMRVIAEFHRRKVVGYVLEIIDAPPENMSARSIKAIEASLEATPTFSLQMLKLLQWMARYYCAPIGEVCRTALPKRLTEINATDPKRISSLEEMKAAPSPKPTLTSEQQTVFENMVTELKSTAPTPILLHGITGSGKTEMYLRLFEEVERSGGQSILLVPEIGLTPQLALRVVERFGDRVSIYHSGLTDAQRHGQWLRMKEGEVSVVVGTRSALFAPLPCLRAIVVDEEHDSSYKQEDGVLYHARDTAVMRGKLEGTVVLLGSATPSLESFFNAASGKYRSLSLTTRATGASLPTVEIVDLRKEKKHPGLSLSERLIEEIETRLARKEQTLLFLNRRGFAHFLLCETCGFVFECPNCNISLTHHLKRAKLVCHYCEYAIVQPTACIECAATTLTPMGSGTERLEEELADFFPQAKVARLDRDTIARKGIRQKIFRNMHDGKIDILVGTQLITKGHDFPNVTLVGIISADSSLHLPDFRAVERTFQLLTQVAGRAGRAEKPGKVIVQTYRPEHFSIAFAQEHDYQGFAEEEKRFRQELGYPPFGRLANIRLSGNNAKRVQEAAEKLAQSFRSRLLPAISLLGPAAAPIEKMRNKYRWHLLLKARSAGPLMALLADAHSSSKKLLPSGVRLTIDVDPMSLL